MKETSINKKNPNKPVKALIMLVSNSFNCREYTWANPKKRAIKLAKNNPKKLSTNAGSKKIINIPINEEKIKTLFF